MVLPSKQLLCVKVQTLELLNQRSRFLLSEGKDCAALCTFLLALLLLFLYPLSLFSAVNAE